ncbi:MAG: hypothetical protein A2734_01185 [Parcubacteria group bacterium RIFCSPHIGHO2_01_FULL_40_30]|nr:MAG: hypothetical protein A2734_01185 [Parcubacteria group bacterium RIFCSPHIGHO2_01_FULL_40_30]OHB19643.1 MAG: hypothetical protein A3D40_02060 [Parcubacteria group bacterium RIFCSPHIGHO2_02_FULL_40_12]OHB23112.1 MAG: hypothetical protein A3I22_00030 [Parcubacteria group bacterium RIFCSPLOWO2_02_FULL_40_12]
MHLVEKQITKAELKKIAEERFGDLVKAVVDIRQEIMAVGGGFHSDEQSFLIEKHNSKGEDTWGINLYPDKPKNEMIEFDSVINIKPLRNNRSRDIEDPEIKEKIKKIVAELILD